MTTSTKKDFELKRLAEGYFQVYDNTRVGFPIIGHICKNKQGLFAATYSNFPDDNDSRYKHNNIEEAVEELRKKR